MPFPSLSVRTWHSPTQVGCAFAANTVNGAAVPNNTSDGVDGRFAAAGTFEGELATGEGPLVAGVEALFAGPLALLDRGASAFARAPGFVAALGAAWAAVAGDDASALAAEHPMAAPAATSNV